MREIVSLPSPHAFAARLRRVREKLFWTPDLPHIGATSSHQLPEAQLAGVGDEATTTRDPGAMLTLFFSATGSPPDRPVRKLHRLERWRPITVVRVD